MVLISNFMVTGYYFNFSLHSLKRREEEKDSLARDLREEGDLLYTLHCVLWGYSDEVYGYVITNKSI